MIGELVTRVRTSRWDPQPTEQAAVLLASAGDPFPRSMVLRGVEAAGGGDIAVVTVARIFGSAWGLPNPGLMPTRREIDAQRAVVDAATAVISGRGVRAWGQIVTTRNAGRSIARVAQARGAQRVFVAVAPAPRWRRVIEGDLVRAIQRRLGTTVEVEGVPIDETGRRELRLGGR